MIIRFGRPTHSTSSNTKTIGAFQMKRLIKRFSAIAVAVLMLLSHSENVAAAERMAVAERMATGYSSYAYSVGTDYSYFLNPNIDTSKDAEYASTAWGMAGYTSYYSLKPTVSYMRGNAPDGRKRMESGIVFLSGHGNYQCVSFNYKGNDGDYKTGIYYGENLDSTTGYKYVGVKSLDLSQTKLMVFAACQTASGTTNIAKNAADMGADATIGWTVSVGASSHTKWLKRFCDEIAAGSTVKRAKEYADSFNYSDNDVKKGKIYGSDSTTVKSVSNFDVMAVRNDEDNKRATKIAGRVAFTEDDLEGFVKRVVSAGKLNINLKDFEIQYNGGTVDLIYVINGVETLYGYSIILDNGYATKVYKNMGDNNSSFARMTIQKRTFSEIADSVIEFEKSESVSRLDPSYTVLGQETKHIFDIEMNKEYLVILTDYMDESGAYGRSEDLIEIKGSSY